MTQDELRATINLMKFRISRETAKTGTEEKFQELIVSGLDVLGEFFMDIKRIADKRG